MPSAAVRARSSAATPGLRSKIHGTDDSGHTTSRAPFPAASAVRARWRSKLVRARVRVPLVLLQDGRLHEAHAHAPRLGRRLRELEEAVGEDEGHQRARRGQRPQRDGPRRGSTIA